VNERNTLKWYIGTSGFSFSDWIGTVYPESIKSSEMFTYYCQHYGFNAVEINYTFYQMPSYKSIVSLLRRAPTGFKFALKIHGSITHEGNLENIANFLKNTHIVFDEGKLAGYLAQFPYTFKYSDENITFLKRIAECFKDSKVFIEFRHLSWSYKEDVVEFIKEYSPNVSIVIVDLPKISGLYPFNTYYNSEDEEIYVRLHGRKKSWFTADEKTRYDYYYTEDELDEISKSILLPNVKKALVFFNNCYRGQALRNARSFREQVGGEKIGIF